MKNKLHLSSALAGAGLTAIAFVASGAALQEEGEGAQASATSEVMQVLYLELVTPDIDATCSLLEEVHGVSFSPPQPVLGNARTAALKGGGQLGVRAPMRDTEEPVVRPYIMVDDIKLAAEAAKAAGSEIAIPPMEIPGRGQFSIYIHGGIEHGLWQP